MNRFWRRAVIPALLLAAAMGLRLHAPTADLPADISFSGSIYTDEGNQCHNSRSKVLFGEWYPDDWRITHYNPVVPYLKYGIFKVLGVGLFQVRLVSFIFAFLSLLFFYWTLRSYLEFPFALLGTGLLGVNFLFVMYNRIGTFETPMIFWMILALFLIEKFRVRERPIFLLLAGASAYMAFIFKNTVAHFLPVPLAACLIYAAFAPPGSKRPPGGWLRRCGWILAGLIGVFLIWLLAFYLPNREWIWNAPGQYIGNQMFPRSLGSALDNFLAFNWKQQFFKIPVVWVFSLLYVPLFVRRLLNRSADISEISVFLYFLSHTVFFMFISNRPTRYLVAVIPAMAFMATLTLRRLWRPPDPSSPPPTLRTRLLLIPLDALWLGLAAYFCLIPLLGHVLPGLRTPPLSWAYALAALAAAVAGHGLKRVLETRLTDSVWRRSTGRVLRITLFSAALATALLVNLYHYRHWDRTKTHTVYDLSRELGSRLQNAYIAGLTAPVAVLENRHRALFLFPRFVNWTPDTFARYPLTHALLASFNHEISLYYSAWPERMEHAALLKTYSVKDQFLHLYSFREPFVAQLESTEHGSLRARVVNPAGTRQTGTLGVASFRTAGGQGRSSSTCVSYLPRIRVDLDPGSNTLEWPLPGVKTGESEARAWLVFTTHEGWEGPLRYEAEKFPRRVGQNEALAGASAGWVRTFRRGRDRPGFLCFGPFVPYSPGLLQVDFHLRLDSVRPGIRPLCSVEVFSYRERRSLVKRILKPRDIPGDGRVNLRLWVLLPDTKTLEFRVFAEGWADMVLDYIDMTYLQGQVTFPEGSVQETISGHDDCCKGGVSGE